MAFVKPFKARCNTCTPRVNEEFYTEAAAKQWGDEHQMINGHDHEVRYALKVGTQE